MRGHLELTDTDKLIFRTFTTVRQLNWTIISSHEYKGNTVVIVPEMDRPYFAILLSIVRGDTLNSWAMMGTGSPGR